MAPVGLPPWVEAQKKGYRAQGGSPRPLLHLLWTDPGGPLGVGDPPTEMMVLAPMTTPLSGSPGIICSLRGCAPTAQVNNWGELRPWATDPQRRVRRAAWGSQGPGLGPFRAGGENFRREPGAWGWISGAAGGARGSRHRPLRGYRSAREPLVDMAQWASRGVLPVAGAWGGRGRERGREREGERERGTL